MTPEPSGLGLGALLICKSRQNTEEEDIGGAVSKITAPLEPAQGANR